jgi:alpha-tubulin suppressor-like RCC1 family protein
LADPDGELVPAPLPERYRVPVPLPGAPTVLPSLVGMDEREPAAVARSDVVAEPDGDPSGDTILRAAVVATPGIPYAWGDHYYGQVGDGTTSNRSTPVAMSGLSSITVVAAGGFHSLARKSDGSVLTWGLNDNGQLGDNSTTNRSTPVTVSNLNQATGVAGGGWHSLAMRSDGTVRGWGDNSYGQLGDNSTTPGTNGASRARPGQQLRPTRG